jgi:hypothetical protein
MGMEWNEMRRESVWLFCFVDLVWRVVQLGHLLLLQLLQLLLLLPLTACQRRRPVSEELLHETADL